MILSEVLHTVWQLATWWAYWLGVVLGVVLVPVVLASRRVPQAKIAWILGVMGFPWIGAFLYLTVGRRTFARKVLRLRGASARSFVDIDRRHGEAGLVAWRQHQSPASKDLVLESERVGAHGPVPGNRYDLLTEGPLAFAAGAEAVKSAKSHVHLVSYIFKSDPTGRGVLALLEEAARRGVEVRVLCDAYGNVATKTAFFDPVRRAGGQVASFLPGGPLRSRFRSNLRNHRKLLVVDGRVAFTGGMNIGDEYATGRSWRDLHCRIEGPVVPTLQRVFAEDWHFASGELLDAGTYYPRPALAGDVPVQVVESGPDQEDPHADELVFSAIASARRSVDIATPYLVPPEPVEQALRSAARRGKRVRILLGEFVDHRIVRWATDAYIPRLLAGGVEIWRHPQMVHSKAVIVDNAWATMGSTNIDARSLRLNFELNVALPHAPTAERLTRWFEGEIAASRRVEARDLRAALPTRIARQAAYLLSPVL